MKAILIFCFILPSFVFAQQGYKYNCQAFMSETCCKRFATYSGTEQCNTLSGWVMMFEDNFDGDSLDMGKWQYPYQGVLAGYDFDGSKTWYANTGTTPSKPVSDNVVLENGSLKLIARKENSPISGIYQNWSNGGVITESPFNYSSGWVESKKNLGYGWYEIRCKIPKGKGMWPAFWLVNGVEGYTYEVDIFEFWNEENCGGNYDANKLSRNPHQNILSDRVNFPQTAKCPTDLYEPCTSNLPVDYSANFHTFALEWDFFKLVWYIDGNPVRVAYRYANYATGQVMDCNSVPMGYAVLMAKYWPQIDNLRVIFNLGVQNNGNEPDASTTLPKEFEIDYFRFYAKGYCSSQSIINSEGWTWNDYVNGPRYATIPGQNVTISGSVSSVTLDSLQQLDVVATNSIILDPGYEVKHGANFTAFIDPGYCDINAIAVNNEPQEMIHDKFQDQENNTLDIESLSSSDIFKVYPNPTSDQLTIELISNSGGLNMIEITDNQGRSLLSDTRELNEPVNLDVGNFSPGTYFIKILNKQTGKVYLERFTKKD